MKLDHFIRDRGENNTYLSCHHLGILISWVYKPLRTWVDEFISHYLEKNHGSCPPATDGTKLDVNIGETHGFWRLDSGPHTPGLRIRNIAFATAISRTRRKATSLRVHSALVGVFFGGMRNGQNNFKVVNIEVVI